MDENLHNIIRKVIAYAEKKTDCSTAFDSDFQPDLRIEVTTTIQHIYNFTVEILERDGANELTNATLEIKTVFELIEAKDKAADLVAVVLRAHKLALLAAKSPSTSDEHATHSIFNNEEICESICDFIRTINRQLSTRWTQDEQDSVLKPLFATRRWINMYGHLANKAVLQDISEVLQKIRLYLDGSSIANEAFMIQFGARALSRVFVQRTHTKINQDEVERCRNKRKASSEDNSHGRVSIRRGKTMIHKPDSTDNEVPLSPPTDSIQDDDAFRNDRETSSGSESSISSCESQHEGDASVIKSEFFQD